MTMSDLDEGIRRYELHLLETAQAFNAYAAEKGLGVSMEPKRLLQAVKNGVGLARIASFWQRSDDTGIVHESQLRTAVDCMVQMLADNKRCGHVVGAMQSGKTTTSLALQWAGPILYLRTGRSAYPFYIIGNQLNHEDQTTTELQRFLSYYGDIDLVVTPEVIEGIDPLFARSPSLTTYRERVLLGALEDYNPVPQLADIVHRRVGGERSLSKIVSLCQRATEKGYRPLMIIDEPQFGASDRFVEGAAGTERHECVLAQMFSRIEQALGSTRDDHWFVGLSATPFEMNDLQRFWEVRQSLTSAYSGFNIFNGEPISPGVQVLPPRTLSLSQFSEEIGVNFLAMISMAAYDGTHAAFARHARKVGYDGSHEEYRAETEAALREAIYRLLERYQGDQGGPVGMCIRAFNDNQKTRALINRLALDPSRIEIVDYYGNEMGGVSIKRMIARRSSLDLPYLVLVTNRARMADAFPRQVRFFMDFAQRATDLNALLQGLLGRACGYNKKSTVVLSDLNMGIVQAYVATDGGYVHKTSRHSLAVNGGFRRGAPTGMLKLRRDMDDDKVRQFFERIDGEVVSLIKPGATLRGVHRSKQGQFRTGPILRIAEDLKLFDHVEDPAVRAILYPELVAGFRVVRPGEVIRHSRDGTELTYATDPNGDCRFTFRHTLRSDAARGGAAGRAKGAKDVGQHIEPTVYVEKYDPVSDEIVEEKHREGHWRAFMVTFPLRDTVRAVRVALVAYPTPACTYDHWMDDRERELRDIEVQRRRG